MTAPAAGPSRAVKQVCAKTRGGYLARHGLAPDVVFDVGVYKGTGFLYRAFPRAKFVLIDPLSESRDLVAAAGLDLDHDFHLLALGAEPGRLPLQVAQTEPGKGGNLSGIHARTDRSRNWITHSETRMVEVATLDSLAARYPGRAGLKIDTEGHEIEVLRGAMETLGRCDFVILELSVTRRFANATLPSAIIALLAASGLELRDVIDMAPPDFGMPRHMDVLFTRWPESGRTNSEGTAANG